MACGVQRWPRGGGAGRMCPSGPLSWCLWASSAAIGPDGSEVLALATHSARGPWGAQLTSDTGHAQGQPACGLAGLERPSTRRSEPGQVPVCFRGGHVVVVVTGHAKHNRHSGAPVGVVGSRPGFEKKAGSDPS